MNSRFLQRMDTTLLVLTLIGTVSWGALTSVSEGATFLVGATLGFANFAVLQRAVGGAIARASTGDQGAGRLTALYVVKFGLLALLIFALIAVVRADAVSLALGLGVIPAAILIEFLRWNLTAAPTQTEIR